MSDRPILFSAAMVRALIDRRKTQTRRVWKAPASCYGSEWTLARPGVWWNIHGGAYVMGEVKSPYAVGDRLWVRERWGVIQAYDDLSPREIGARHFYDGRYHGSVGYSTDDIGRWCQTGCNGAAGRWRPSIHMPRWASRLTLTVTNVRVQRLQEISEDDAVAEGVETEGDDWLDYQMPSTQCCTHARDSYRTLWDSLNAKHLWARNPWVVALTFTVAQKNIDRLEVS